MAAHGQGLLAPPRAPGLVPTSVPGQPLMKLPTGQQQQQQMNTMMPGMPNNLPLHPPSSMGGPPSMYPRPPPPGVPLLAGSDPVRGVQPQAGGPDSGMPLRPPLMDRAVLPPPATMRFAAPPNLPRPPLNMPPGGAPRPLMGLIPPQTAPPKGPPLQDFPPPGSQTEVWFEYKTAEGKPYYSHPQTQKTTWERPKDAQIIPQPSSAPPASTRAPAPRFPFHPTPRLPGLPSPGAPQLVPTRVWSEHKTQEGKIYFYNKVTKQSVWEKPKDFELVMPLPADFNTPPSSGSPVTAARQGISPNPTFQSQQVPPVSFQSGFVPGPTHLVSQTSQPNLEVGRPAQLVTQTSQTALEMDRPTQPVTQTSNDQERSNELEQMDTDVSNDQREMDTEDHGPDSPQVQNHQPSEGTVTSTATVESAATTSSPNLMPTSAQMPPQTQTSPSPQMSPMSQRPPAAQMFPIDQRPPIAHRPPSFIHPPPFMMRPRMPPFDPPMIRPFLPPRTMMPGHGRPPLVSVPPPRIPFQIPPTENTPIMVPQASQEKLPSEEPVQEKPFEVEPREEHKGPRPMANVPIPGTPWSVVWTTDERSFFFNITSRNSVWTLPDDLEDNPHVAKILDEPPWARKRIGEVKSLPDSKRLRLDSNENSDSEENEEDQMDQQEEQLPPTIVSQGGAPVIAKEMRSSVVTEREQKATLAKAGKTLEERQRDFKEMLLEREVSAFSTWDKELPKFVFDPRYLLLNTKERKSCFESFIRSRAEEERKERKTKLKEKRDQFKALLEEAKLQSKSSFSEFASKYGKDERFKSIDKMKEREQLFTEHLAELKKMSKHKDATQKQTAKSKAEKIKSDFVEMLGESEAITERSQWKKMKSFFDRDTRYKAVESSTQREEWFKEYANEKSNQTDPEQEKQERIQASLKEREREVKMSRSAHEKEWGRERDQLRKAEAIQDYKALLVDMVRSSDAIWYDTKRSLRHDRRWKMVELLDIDEKESLFQEHVSNLGEKKRLRFWKLLGETSQISLTMSWKKARKLIKEDPRYKSFGDSDHRREHEYDKFMRDTMVTAKNDFKLLLKETKLISYKSHDMINESEKHYKDIVDVLKKDKRYLILACVSDDRDRMLEDYISDLHKRGPPPPPTATHPSDRLRRPAPGPLVT